ncbi:MAG TPA: four helix bundle protein [Gemmatimonadaceae bacterium]|jgi:four helix bundle protein|nr:four helix bundle protein [Gemmatimonadaceae bacterium]
MPIIHDEDFKAWEACVPVSLREDQMWKFHAYRVALYLLDLATRDVEELRVRKCVPHQSDQLLRAVASISANVAEGFGRNSAADRSRCFGIALGSLRESFTWYRAVKNQLPPETIDLRFEQLAELRRILIGAQKWLASKPQKTQLM